MRRSIDVQPVVLEGETIRLVPIEEAHAAELLPHAELDIFTYFLTVRPRQHTEQGVVDYIRDCLRQYPKVVTFTIVHKESGEMIGSSSYLDIRPDDLMVEIGMTWISKAYQKTKVNPEIKLLMLQHAFETLGCARVQLKCDGRNLQSQSAIEKLGAKKEGVLRNYGQMLDGFVRDTVMYSILPEEWPEVKQKLLNRLNYSHE